MEGVERLAVHLGEAVRLAKVDNEAHLRLSLILFDSAFELIMHRAKSPWIPLQRELYDAVAEADELANAQGIEITPEEMAEAKARGLSKRQAVRIERDFNGLADHVIAEGRLSERDGRVAKRLHEYRNETYHRDHLRTDTVRQAVAVYGDIACRAFRDSRPLMGLPWSSNPKPVPPGLQPYFTSANDMSGFVVWATVGSALLDLLGPLDPDLGSALSQNMVQRIQTAQASLVEWIRFVGNPAPESPDALDRLLFTLEFDFVEPSEVWDVADKLRSGRRGKITSKKIEGWIQQAEQVASIADPLEAFAAFIDLEICFEPLEKNANEALRAIDQMVEDEINLRRGK